MNEIKKTNTFEVALPKTDFPMKGDLPKKEPQTIEFWNSQKIYQKRLQKNSKNPLFVLPDGPPYANGSIHIGHALNKVLKDIIIKYKNMTGYQAVFRPGWDCHGLPIEQAVSKKLGDELKQKNPSDIRQLCRQEAKYWVEVQKEQFIRLGILADWQNPYLTMNPDYEAEQVREFARAFTKGVIYRGVKPVYWNWSLQTALAEAEVEYHNHKSPSIYIQFVVKPNESLFKKWNLSLQGRLSFLVWTTTPWTLPANVAICLNKEFNYGIYQVTQIESAQEQGNKEQSNKVQGNKEQSNKEQSNREQSNNERVSQGQVSLEKSTNEQSNNKQSNNESTQVDNKLVNQEAANSPQYVIFAEGLLDSVQKQTGLEYKLVYLVTKEELSDFDCLHSNHPFYDRPSPIIYGDHVTLEAGTGCVHTAPGHGADDYKVGFLNYGLQILSPVGPDGTFTSEVPEYQGVHIFKANPMIVQRLLDNHTLLWSGQVEHSYPHCWRTKIPLIFRATPQWFIGLDLPDSKIREKALKAINEIQFYPDWGRARFEAMVQNRPDWCLSRQRIWGVPVPVLICKKTGEPLAHADIMNRIADVIQNEGGIDAFYKHDPKDFLGFFKASGEFGSEGFMHSQDILDVWFDSGIVHAAVQKKTHGMGFPADVYLEGSDQHRGWFNTSLLTSIVTNDVPPFKKLLTHGFIQQSKGVKMSKSKGGGADPLEFSNTKGADILRLWCAHEDYGKDIIWGDDLVERVTETYRRLRNTMRFLLGAIYDFDYKVDVVSPERLTKLDQWALHRLNQLVLDMRQAYDETTFYKAYHLLNQYVTVDLSSVYLDILKDRLYTFGLTSYQRRSAQTTIYHILKVLNPLMAPILSFLAEEIYSYRKDKSQESIFLEEIPDWQASWDFAQISKEFGDILKIREIAQKQLEELRAQKVIGSSLEAQVDLQLPKNDLEMLNTWEQLREIFIVSKISLTQGDFKVQSSRAEGEKCPRCWVFTTQMDPALGVCSKCKVALDG